MKTLSNKEIDKAYNRIKHLISKTPLITNEEINSTFNAKIYFKLENLQKTGSFKLRGASNKISQLSNKQKSYGIVAFSSGNHAQAVAYTSKFFGVDSKIVMPKNAPKLKIENTKNYGAQLVLCDSQEETRAKIAEEIAKKENRIIIKPYDDLEIITGQGTVGKEIVDQLNKYKVVPDIYLCCCGGGGLIAGSSFYLKNSFPNIKNFAVEPEDFNDTQLSLKSKKIETIKPGKTICDALLAVQPGNVTFPINSNTLTSGLTVSDNEVKKTIIKLAEEMKVVAEPGGAVAATALFENKLDFKNKNVIVMISGGNIDNSFFSSLVDK